MPANFIQCGFERGNLLPHHLKLVRFEFGLSRFAFSVARLALRRCHSHISLVTV